MWYPVELGTGHVLHLSQPSILSESFPVFVRSDLEYVAFVSPALCPCRYSACPSIKDAMPHRQHGAGCILVSPIPSRQCGISPSTDRNPLYPCGESIGPLGRRNHVHTLADLIPKSQLPQLQALSRLAFSTSS